jgi:hypothetical protein
MTDAPSMIVRDGRLTTIIGWGAAVFGSATLMVGGWIASNIASLNTTVTTLVVETRGINRRLDVSDVRDDTQDARIDDLTGSVRTLEGRNMRGHTQEPRRGR